MSIKNDVKTKNGKLAQITKSNNLLLGHYSMTATQHKIVSLAIKSLRNQYPLKKNILQIPENEQVEAVLSAKEIADFLMISPGTVYSILDDVSTRLMNMYFEVKEEGRGFVKIRPYPFAKYVNGVFTLRFEKSMTPLIANLEAGEYSTESLEAIKYLKKSSSIRLYEILCVHAWKGSIRYAIDDLKEELALNIETKEGRNVEAKQIYSTYKMFNAKYLGPAIREINERTELNVTYTPLRLQGRSYSHIDFAITHKNDTEMEGIRQTEKEQTKDRNRPVPVEEYTVMARVMMYTMPELTENDIVMLLMSAGGDHQSVYKQYGHMKLAQEHGQEIREPVAWLISAIQRDYPDEDFVYDKPVPKKKGSFKDMSQRAKSEKDYTELEKKRLGIQ